MQNHGNNVCSVLQVDEDDGLPTQICKKCVNNVNNWYAFKKVCDDSQLKLQNWLNGDGSGESVKFIKFPYRNHIYSILTHFV